MLVKLYIKEVARLLGTLKAIMSDRYQCFTSRFFRVFQWTMGTQIKMNCAFHPQTDGQMERTITIENMHGVCVLEWHGEWDEHLSLVGFICNNSYHSSIGMTPFEALYRRPFYAPGYQSNIAYSKLKNPLVLQYYKDQMQMIRKKLKVMQDRQKSYTDRRSRELIFIVGIQFSLRDHQVRVYLDLKKGES